MFVKSVVAAALLLLPGAAFAQSGNYAGQDARAVKALSPQQIADLRAGRGMGLALAAELNGYPGPMHVLELADLMGLDDSQKSRIRELFAAMHREAVAVGDRLIAAEILLDRAFAERRITAESLNASTQAVAVLQGELRAIHLRYHLATVEVLNADQVARYGALRGYMGDGRNHRGHPPR